MHPSTVITLYYNTYDLTTAFRPSPHKERNPKNNKRKMQVVLMAYHIFSQLLITWQPILLWILGNNCQKCYQMLCCNNVLWLYQVGKISDSQAEHISESDYQKLHLRLDCNKDFGSYLPVCLRLIALSWLRTLLYSATRTYQSGILLL